MAYHYFVSFTLHREGFPPVDTNNGITLDNPIKTFADVTKVEEIIRRRLSGSVRILHWKELEAYPQNGESTLQGSLEARHVEQVKELKHIVETINMTRSMMETCRKESRAARGDTDKRKAYQAYQIEKYVYQSWQQTLLNYITSEL